MTDTYGPTARVSPGTLDLVDQALREHGPQTRAALQTITGLSRPSVSGAVSALLDQGRVEEEPIVATGRGRPSSRIRVSRRQVDVVGIEIGRGHVAVAAVNAGRAVIATQARAVTSSRSLLRRAADALELLERLRTEQELELSALRLVMVGTPGPRFHSPRGGADFSLSRLERERAAVAALVTDRLGAPTDTGNNTRFTALGESRRHRRSSSDSSDGPPDPDVRSGQSADDLVYLRVDEGVGGGLVLGGSLAAGAGNAAGEFGHVSVDPRGETCLCGGRGCLELTASLPALLKATGAGGAAELLARAGQRSYAAAIRRAAEATGTVLAGVLATANPRLVVVGGVVADLPGFLPRVESVLGEVAPRWALSGLEIRQAVDDHLLGATGAAEAAADRLDHRGALTMITA